MTDFIRINSGLAIVAALFCGVVLVLSFVGILMKRAGVSLKPLAWFAGFMGFILLPQLIGHAINAYMAERMERLAPEPEPLSNGAVKPSAVISNLAANLDYSDPEKLFASKSAGVIAVDGRSVASGLLHGAKDPKFFLLPDGSTLLIGRFPTLAAAQNAVQQFLREARLTDRVRADGNGGYSGQRNPNDQVYVRAYDELFTVWSGPSDAAIEELQLAAGFTRAGVTAQAHGGQRGGIGHKDFIDAALGHITSTMSGVALVVGVLAVYLLIVAAYFFKGIAWATRATPLAGTNPAAAYELREKLKAINKIDVPFKIEDGKTAQELIANWRYADAKWIDHARVHGMRRLHRIVLALDEQSKKVRATDYQTAYDWSAGGAGARLNWQFQTGVVLFQYEHQRVFGLQLDSQGGFRPALSYAYTFNLQEMKEPLKQAVVQSGWTWQPVAWLAPSWLRWLTE